MTITTQLAPRACALWFTGLSGAGKSTTAEALLAQLQALGYASYLIDGDQMRRGLCRDLGFSAADRDENIRRLGEVTRLMVDAGVITLVAAISPFQAMRKQTRLLFAAGQYLEIFVDAPLALCEARDPKGLYRKARAGELAQFTGISSPYEAPTQADVHLPTGELSTADCVAQLLAKLRAGGHIA